PADLVDGRLGGRSAIARAAGHAVAEESVDISVRGDDADAVVSGVGDVQIALGVENQSIRTIEPGIDRRSAVPGIGSHAVSGDAGKRALGTDLENAIKRRVVKV